MIDNSIKIDNDKLPDGTILFGGKYRVDECVCSEDFENTYIVRHMAFDELMIMKELSIKDLCHQYEFAQKLSSDGRAWLDRESHRFVKMYRFMNKANSCHIAKVLDIFQENGTAYCILEKVEGPPLSCYIRSGQPLSVLTTLNFLKQLLDALDAIHKVNLFHLCVTPSNIVIDNRGQLTLINNGSCKWMALQNYYELYGDDIVKNPPVAGQYCPPELFEINEERFGPWTDLYQLGGVLFQMLTGKQPPSLVDIMEEGIDRFVKGIYNRQMRDLLIWMLQPRMSLRPQSVQDVRSYLEKITCSIIQPWEYKGCDDLTVFIVPDGTMSICHHVFFNCRQLRFVSLPEDLETIGENAFSGCCSLTAIYIPDSVREIDIFAFEDCKSLTQVSVPSTLLDSIGKGSFAGCVSLKTFFVRDSNGIVEDITIKDEWK